MEIVEACYPAERPGAGRCQTELLLYTVAVFGELALNSISRRRIEIRPFVELGVAESRY